MPSALLPSPYWQTNQPFNSYIIKALTNAGFEVCQSPYSKDLAVGEKARVAAVLSIIREQAVTGAFYSDYHRKWGEALGYPTEAIRRFNDSLARGELGLDGAVVATAFPADDESLLKISLPTGRSVVVR